jgi:pantoate--beta-alanine ligase
MKTLRTRAELRDALATPRREGSTIGLVPTMGYLHEGHLSLLRAASADCDLVVMSLFVNPAQFGPGEDLERYPRDEDRDQRLAEEAGVDLLYAPPVEEVYPDGYATHVEVEGMTDVICGDPARRGRDHFRGVTTVVAKLLNTVQPDAAYFGQKDAQQAIVIRRMVADLDFPVRVDVLPTVREPDGLALSSRNAYLDEEQRRRAAAIPRSLQAARDAAKEGSLAEAVERARGELKAAGIEPEYLEARDASDLKPAAELNGRPVLLSVAAQVGDARLIDNVLIEPAGE